MDNRVLITNIQRFSLHDGPGIRTTLFCKGCSLHCPWCSNPENIRPQTESYVKNGKSGVYGRAYTCDELYKEIVKDRVFYDQRGASPGLSNLPGGVTFSGGEPLLQFDRLEPLLDRLKAEGINICVETCLFVSEDKLKTAIEYVDLFYIDIKILDSAKCKDIIGGDIRQYMSNVETVFASNKPVVFRIPVIGGYTDDAKNREAVIGFLKKFTPIKVELIKEHNLGQSKYASLGKTAIVLDKVTDRLMERYKNEIQFQTKVEMEVCKV